MTNKAASPDPLAPESGNASPTTPSAALDEASRKHFEALFQRINDTYARFTPEEMELVKALGWG